MRRSYAYYVLMTAKNYADYGYSERRGKVAWLAGCFGKHYSQVKLDIDRAYRLYQRLGQYNA